MLELLKVRFSEHKELHPDLDWSEVEHRLREAPAAIAVLQKMEESGGEPDTMGYDVKTGNSFSATAQRNRPSGAEACAMTKRHCKDEQKTRRQAVPNGKRKKSEFQ